MLFDRERIDNDDALYQQYWSEFESYYPHHGIQLTPKSGGEHSYYFEMEGFEGFQIDLGVYLLEGNSAISANIFLNKGYNKASSIFESIESAVVEWIRMSEIRVIGETNFSGCVGILKG